jgi:hydrogenase maturation factor
MTPRRPSTRVCCEEHCITCSDEGVPMTVLRVNEAAGLALCGGVEGERVTVEAALVGPLSLGDRVLVHAGTAIATLDAVPGEVAEALA